MFIARVQTPAQTSARAALRGATDASHQKMHGILPFVQIAAGTLPISQYCFLLQSLFRFHSAVGREARRSGWTRLSSAEQRLALLRSDLSFLGEAVPDPVDDWQVGTGEAILGALYAAEGSMFGGRVIAGQLDYIFETKAEGRRFFIGDKCDRGNWIRLLEVLEERCDDPSALCDAKSGALRTFDLFEQLVTALPNSTEVQLELPS